MTRMSNIHFRRLVAAVSRESGICKPTVEVVLPVVFDVMRRDLTEGDKQCVQIESFGTLAVKELSARGYHYRRPEKGIDRWVEKPARRILKFSPTKNMRRAVEQGRFDPSRRSFFHHPDDPKMRYRSQFKTRCENPQVYKSPTVKKKNGSQDILDQKFPHL